MSVPTKKKVCVRVPATTANVGPGFDTLGIALRVYNQVDLTLLNLPEIILVGESNPQAIKMAMQASRAFFKKAHLEERGLKIQIRGEVPIARGLGSSVTVRLGIIAGLNHFYKNPLGPDQVLQLVSGLEGHPDNAAPALFGGLAVSGFSGDAMDCIRKKLPSRLKFVAAIPDFEVETKKARELLPEKISFTDAVYNVNRVALLVAALWDEDYKSIGNFLEDRLHQSYRAKLIPQLFDCLNAAKLAGAIGGWLSGSGSTVMALTLSNPEKVGRAMAKVFKDSGRSCRVLITEADNDGVKCQATE